MAFFTRSFITANTPHTTAVMGITSSGQKSCTSNSTPLSSDVPVTAERPSPPTAAISAERRLMPMLSAVDSGSADFSFTAPCRAKPPATPAFVSRCNSSRIALRRTVVGGRRSSFRNPFAGHPLRLGDLSGGHLGCYLLAAGGRTGTGYITKRINHPIC